MSDPNQPSNPNEEEEYVEPEQITESAGMDDTIVTDDASGAIAADHLTRAGGPDILPDDTGLDPEGNEPLIDDEV